MGRTPSSTSANVAGIGDRLKPVAARVCVNMGCGPRLVVSWDILRQKSEPGEPHASRMASLAPADHPGADGGVAGRRALRRGLRSGRPRVDPERDAEPGDL